MSVESYLADRLVKALARSPAGMTSDQVARLIGEGDEQSAVLRGLARSSRILPCYCHGGTESGPPELVYHAFRT